MSNPTNPESKVPERVYIDLAFFDEEVECWSAYLTRVSESTEFIPSDIAQAQTNRKVRECLMKIVRFAKPDKDEEECMYYFKRDDLIPFIDNILNEYPDLLTNEEKKVNGDN